MQRQVGTVEFLKAKASQLSEENKKLRTQMAAAAQQQAAHRHQGHTSRHHRHDTSMTAGSDRLFRTGSPPASHISDTSPTRRTFAPSSPGLGPSYDDFTLRSRDTGMLDRSMDRCDGPRQLQCEEAQIITPRNSTDRPSIRCLLVSEHTKAR